VKEAYAYNQRRRELFEGLVNGAIALREAGAPKLYPDGSFVTAKPIPGDYDAVWDWVGVDDAKLDPVFRNFHNLRQAHKDKFGGEFFPMEGQIFRLFQREKATHLPKGILVIDLMADAMLIAGAS
jgi:hypothetical protein